MQGDSLFIENKTTILMFMFLHTGERPLRCVQVSGVCAHNIHAPLYRRGNGETGSAQINVYIIHPQRMREGYSIVLTACVCVSLSTLEATLIYSANNGYQWTANDNLFIFKKMKTCKSAPSIQKQLSKLTALYTY